MMDIGRRTVVCALAGTEHDEALTRVTVVLAERLGLRTELVHVNRLSDMAMVGAGGIAVPLPEPEDARERSREHLRQVSSAAGERDATCVVVDGPPAEILERVSRREDVAYVVVGDHGAGPLRALVDGSLTRSLLRTTRCPLLVVPKDGSPEAIEQPAAVVRAVDEEATARPAVAAARELGRRLGVIVMVRTVEEDLLDLPAASRPLLVVAATPRHGRAWSLLHCSLPERLLTLLESQLLLLVPDGGEREA